MARCLVATSGRAVAAYGLTRGRYGATLASAALADVVTRAAAPVAAAPASTPRRDRAGSEVGTAASWQPIEGPLGARSHVERSVIAVSACDGARISRE